MIENMISPIWEIGLTKNLACLINHKVATQQPGLRQCCYCRRSTDVAAIQSTHPSLTHVHKYGNTGVSMTHNWGRTLFYRTKGRLFQVKMNNGDEQTIHCLSSIPSDSDAVVLWSSFMTCELSDDSHKHPL